MKSVITKGNESESLKLAYVSIIESLYGTRMHALRPSLPPTHNTFYALCVSIQLCVLNGGFNVWKNHWVARDLKNSCAHACAYVVCENIYLHTSALTRTHTHVYLYIHISCIYIYIPPPLHDLRDLRVEFLLKTESGYLRDAEVT